MSACPRSPLKRTCSQSRKELLSKLWICHYFHSLGSFSLLEYHKTFQVYFLLAKIFMFCKCRRKGLTCLYLFFQRQMPMRRRSTKDSHHLTGSGLPSEILQAASKSRPWPPPGLSNSPPHTIKSKYLKNWTEGGRGRRISRLLFLKPREGIF